jgi:phospholipase D
MNKIIKIKKIVIFLSLIFCINCVVENRGDVKKIYFTPSSKCENLIIDSIKKYNKIDIVIYAINNDNIVSALKKAKDKNKNIRIIVDNTQSKLKYSKYEEMVDYGIEIRQSKKYRVEHNKFAIFDDNNVITGSFNYTNAASKRNSENCILIFDRNKSYGKRFSELWKLYERKQQKKKTVKKYTGGAQKVLPFVQSSPRP